MEASRVPKPRCASNTCETQVPESIPLIDVTVSHSSSQVHPCPGHLVFSFFASGNSSQLMPSALQPFFYSCLVSSLMLYFEVVRSYPRRGKALAQHHPTPASRSLFLPFSRSYVLDYSLNLGTVTISVLPCNCKCSPSPPIPIPRSSFTLSRPFAPYQARRWQAGCIIRSTLIRPQVTATTEFTVPPVPTRLHPTSTSTSPPLVPLPPGEEEVVWGRILSKLGSSPPVQPTHTHARTHNWHTHTEEMHTARVPDPGLLSVRPVSPPPLCPLSRGEIGCVHGRTWQPGLACDAMRCDAMHCLSTQHQSQATQSAQARRHIEASGLLYGSGG